MTTRQMCYGVPEGWYHFLTSHRKEWFMKAVKLVALLLALGLCERGAIQADDFRLTAFALTCLVPFTPGLHTRAVLTGKIKLAHRQVRFIARCFDDTATTGFP